MKKSTRTMFVLSSAGALIAASIGLAQTAASGGDVRPPVVVVQPKPIAAEDKIQVALLLDTSGSMDGLISQAKSQLWKIVNELAHAKRDGRRPKLEIALYEYGNDGLSAQSGYIRQVLPFTGDLDKVSEELFKLTTNGGSEYCGQVIQTATAQLDWSAGKQDLKLIFIAGNEPFTQGPVDYHRAIGAAKEKGIRVNTIYCGGNDPGWQDAAVLAMGEYMTIDQDRAVVHIAAPQDEEIAKLGVEINGTYLAYGARGAEGQARQFAQDDNAHAAAPGSMTARAVSKSSGLYENSTWDLVDAYRGGADVAKMAEADLPEPMKKMTPDERKAYVEAMATRRGAVQQRIQTLNAEREAFVAAELKKQGLDGANTLDVAMIKVVHGQASASGWKFE